MNPPLYHYVVVREDMPLGNICAQAVHAAGETAVPLPPEGTHAVCLAAKNHEDLLNISQQLHEKNISHKVIYEPDAPFNGQATAIGVYPVSDRTLIKQALRKLKLLR